MTKIAGILFLILISISGFAQINQVLEAEKAVLMGTAQIVSCNSASGGQMVKGLDNEATNSLTFKALKIPATGEYFIRVSYYSVNERVLTWQVNHETAKVVTVPATGLWCYQGGLPGDFVFKTTFKEGENNLTFYNSPIIDKIVLLTDTTARKASAIYISSSTGNDSHDGLTPETAIQSLSKLNAMDLVPGDSLLFKSGDTFTGELAIVNKSGSPDKPILISNFGKGNLPVLDGDGYLSAIHVVNSGYLHFSNIEIRNDGGPAKPGVSEELRYGMFIENTFTDGTSFEHYRLNNLTFKNIYPTVNVTDDDNTGVNAHAIITSGSWGDTEHPTRFRDMTIENCYFTRTARHAAVLKSIDDLVIRNNLFEHVGGAGMVINNNSSNILVENNITNYTGSKIDPRMAGRGSGIWCYRTKNLTVQHNKFMHARGIHDSYGMHIDIGNRNVVYQFNYSEDNEGGFVEILGENVNVGYRYNLSVGDGWRKRGNRFGQIFWLAGWSGDPKNPVGSDSIFIYNNSVYVRDSISPGIWIESVSKNARIYNNIIHAAGKFGPVVIKNDSKFNDFDNNIWYGNIPVTDEDGDLYRGPNAKTGNPLFKDEIVSGSSGFMLLPESPAINSGKIVVSEGISRPFDYFLNNNKGFDFYGNPVLSGQNPNIGAYNGKPLGVGVDKKSKTEQLFKVYPNPLHQGEKLTIEIPGPAQNQDAMVYITDVTGKVRLKKSLQNQQKLDFLTDKLPAGFYLITVTSRTFMLTKNILVY